MQFVFCEVETELLYIYYLVQLDASNG